MKTRKVKLYKIGDLFTEIEPLFLELLVDQELQKGEFLAIINELLNEIDRDNQPLKYKKNNPKTISDIIKELYKPMKIIYSNIGSKNYVLAICATYVDIHVPGRIEQYTEGGRPGFYYGYRGK